MIDLLTAQDRAQLLQNGARTAAGEDDDLPPVVKLFTPDGAATWLLTELDPNDPDLAFGLCDPGLGSPEMGHVRLSEIIDVVGQLGLAVERDASFKPERLLSEYARLALAEGRIVP